LNGQLEAQFCPFRGRLAELYTSDAAPNGAARLRSGESPSVVENAINFGSKTLGNTPDEIVHTFENVRVVANLDATRVIIVITTGK
jgi:hypothetical protein